MALAYLRLTQHFFLNLIQVIIPIKVTIHPTHSFHLISIKSIFLIIVYLNSLRLKFAMLILFNYYL